MAFNKKTKVAFLGGDMRTAIAASRLADKMDIYTWRVAGTEGETAVSFCEELSEAVAGADAVILPLPTSLDGKTLNCGRDDQGEKVALRDIVDVIDKNSIVAGGRLPVDLVQYTTQLGIRTVDYFESEVFQINNAYTTAEAALNIAMNSLLKNIRGASFAITGYGRISKQLVRLLRMMDARVCVAARKDSDLAWARLGGCEVLKLTGKSATKALASGYDVIFNTVPYPLFDEDFLRSVDKRTILIELASTPGGIDVSAAKRLRSAVLWAASLPGKYAPQSAGELIADCVENILGTEVE